MTVTSIGAEAETGIEPGDRVSEVVESRLEDPSINVCFSTTNALVSRWIRFVTRAPVSHALITFDSRTLDRVMVMEATGRGFNLVPWRRWRKHNQLIARFRIERPVADQVEALHALSDELGAEYDRLSLFGFALRRWRKRSRNPLDDPGKLICSEVVAKFLGLAGLPGYRDPGEWTPADLFNELLARPELFRKMEEGEGMEAATRRARGKKRRARGKT